MITDYRVRSLTPENCEAIAVLDPLHADEAFRKLPTLNSEKKAKELVNVIRSVTPKMDVAEKLSFLESIAAVRDLGILCASLRRHEFEPVDEVPELEAPLLFLSERTGMIPRETVFHYSVWNPRGPRQRQFMSEHAENVLIDAARMGAIGTEQALLELLKLRSLPIDSPEFVQVCDSASAHLESMTTAVESVRQHMTPEFFAQSVRPYYEEFRVGTKKYSGAAAAPLSLGMVDHLLWSSDKSDPRFDEFQDRALQYNLPKWRRLYDETKGTAPLATRVMAEAAENKSEAAAAGGRAFFNIFRTLMGFRGRHKGLATAAYNEVIRLYPVGSGGFSVDMLAHILSLTRDAAMPVRHSTQPPRHH